MSSSLVTTWLWAIKSSSQRFLGRACRRPFPEPPWRGPCSGSQSRMSELHRSSSRRATCPAHWCCLRLCSSHHGGIFSFFVQASISPVARFSQSTHGSRSSASASLELTESQAVELEEVLEVLEEEVLVVLLPASFRARRRPVCTISLSICRWAFLSRC